MYSTCIFCHSGLGANEAIETFPVGRRLVFDASKGRLWVVCHRCARWNLTPLETRWEAIEECERVFRDARMRFATDHIGLARVREGMTLVRIGRPQRHEIAAWRYGDQFNRRRWKYAATVAAATVGVGSIVVAGPALGLISWATAITIGQWANWLRDARGGARVPVGDQVVRLNKLGLQGAQIRPDTGQGFVVHFGYRPAQTLGDRLFEEFVTEDVQVTLHGADAVRAARVLLPRINRAGGRPGEIATAVAAIEQARSVDEMFSDAARMPHESLSFWKRPLKDGRKGDGPFVLASSLPTPVRLALEMALHEDDERRALEGELAELEERWREAEEIAAISDNLLLPRSVTERLAQLQRPGDA